MPPFRADHVGSLLRPPELLRARADHAAGRITRAELRRIEDAAVRQAVRMQEEIGLQGVTDGEFRRIDWLMDFKLGIGGVEQVDTAPVKVPFRSESGGDRLELRAVPDRQPPAPQGHDLRGGFHLPPIGHEGDAEAHDSLAEHDALSGRARDRPRRLSRHGAVFRRSRAGLHQGDRGRSPRSAAPTCRWTTPAWRCSMIRRGAPRSERAPIPTTCATSRCSTRCCGRSPPA